MRKCHRKLLFLQNPAQTVDILAGVYNVDDIVDRDAGLCDVGRDDNLQQSQI